MIIINFLIKECDKYFATKNIPTKYVNIGEYTILLATITNCFFNLHVFFDFI